jgi:hypothetical protein
VIPCACSTPSPSLPSVQQVAPTSTLMRKKKLTAPMLDAVPKAVTKQTAQPLDEDVAELFSAALTSYIGGLSGSDIDLSEGL